MTQPQLSAIQLKIAQAKLKAQAIREGKPINYYLTEQPSDNSTPAPQVSQALSLLNLEQQNAVDIAMKGLSFVLQGPAGTGKTFTVKSILTELIKNHHLPIMTDSTANLTKAKDYGFIACAFTRRATQVVRSQLPDGLKACTIHKLLEYTMEFIEVIQDGKVVKKPRFYPARNKDNPLPSCLKLIVIDESSMVSTTLFKELEDACPHRPQIIFIGDLNQLKPVFDDSILGYKLTELPVVELKKVYRQKDGEILNFATDIREGKPLTNFTTPEYKNERLNIMQFRTPDAENVRVRQFGGILSKLIDSDQLNPLAGDLILMPQNVGVGTIEVNKQIADYYDQKTGRLLYHIISGFNNLYLAVGDKILIDRNDAIITKITTNPMYSGKYPSLPSAKLNRWGGMRTGAYMSDTEDVIEDISEDDDLESLMSVMVNASLDIDERSTSASHVIHYSFINDESDTVHQIKNTGDVNKIELSYAITVHKSQGSQANHVVILLSSQHRMGLHRELLYTAVTRAQSKCTIYADSGNISKCIMSPRIKGNTLEAKIEYFKTKMLERQS